MRGRDLSEAVFGVLFLYSENGTRIDRTVVNAHHLLAAVTSVTISLGKLGCTAAMTSSATLF